MRPARALAAVAAAWALALALGGCGEEAAPGPAAPLQDLESLRREVARFEADVLREEAAVATLRADVAALDALDAARPPIALRVRRGPTPEVQDALGVGGGPPSAHGQRVGKASLAREGGTEATEKAVEAALHWLARNQEPDGRWLAADSRFDVSVTALAVLAFLGSGHTHKHAKEPAFRRALNHGLDALKRARRDDGSIGFDPRDPDTIVNHALAAQALADLFAASKDFTVKRYAREAVDFAVAAQNPGLGWGRGVRSGADDGGLTGLFVLALAAARAGGLEVPPASFEGALASLDRAPGDAAAAGIGVLARILAGRKPDDAAVQAGLRTLVAAPPAKDDLRPDLAAWCVDAHAVFQATASGSPAWKAWNEAFQVALLGRQRRGGGDDGSFDPTDRWGEAGGRVYATAVAALALEVYYRLERPGR